MALNPVGQILKKADKTLESANATLGTVGGTLTTVEGTLGTVEGRSAAPTPPWRRPRRSSGGPGLLTELTEEIALVKELPALKRCSSRSTLP